MFRILSYRKVASTNETAKKIASPNTVVIAQEQTHGKGRFQRAWSSELGGIYLSVILATPEKPHYLTFVAAIAAQRAIQDVIGVNTIIKWPNDLLYNSKKVCGILTETITGSHKLTIVGVGINSNNKIRVSLKKKALSLKEITKKKIDNKQIIGKFLFYFRYYYSYAQKRKYTFILTEWKKRSFLGTPITAKTVSSTYSGTAFDLDKEGNLLLKRRNGVIKKIKEGDIFLSNQSQ